MSRLATLLTLALVVVAVLAGTAPAAPAPQRIKVAMQILMQSKMQEAGSLDTKTFKLFQKAYNSRKVNDVSKQASVMRSVRTIRGAAALRAHMVETKKQNAKKTA